MDKLRQIKQLGTIYQPGVIVISAVTGLLFFLFPAILLITLFVNIVLLYMHQFLIFYMVLYMMLYGVLYYGVHIFIETLKNNAVKEQLQYQSIVQTLSTALGFVVLLIFTIIYLYIF